MRHSLLAATAFLFLCSAHAQFVEYADQRRPDVVYDKILDLGDRFVIGAWENTTSGAFGGPGHFVNIVGHDGVEIASVPVPMPLTGEYQLGFFGSMVQSSSNGLYLLGVLDGCDYFDRSRLLHIATDGTVLIDRQAPVQTSQYGYDQLAESPTDLLAFVSHEEVAIGNLLGDSLTSWPNPLFKGLWEPAHGHWMPSGDLLLFSGDRLMMVDTSGTELFYVQLDAPIHDTRVFQSELLVLTDGQLHHLSLELEPIESYPAVAGSSPSQFVHGGFSVYYRIGDDLWEWTGMGTALALELSLLEGQIIRSMVIVDDTLFTSGTDGSHGYTTGLLRSYAFEGATSDHELDASVIEVLVDSSWASTLPQNPSVLSVHANLSITIRNDGSTPIDALVLARRVSIPVLLCGDPAARIQVTDLPLLPGATHTMMVEDQLISMSFLSPDPLDLVNNICIVAQSPNGHVDRNHSNDGACVTLTTLVGLNELREIPLSIFPNPFTDQLTVQTPTAQPLTIRLFDATGRTVHTERMFGNGTLSLPELANGSYVIEATDGELQWRQSLVKVDL